MQEITNFAPFSRNVCCARTNTLLVFRECEAQHVVSHTQRVVASACTHVLVCERREFTTTWVPRLDVVSALHHDELAPQVLSAEPKDEKMPCHRKSTVMGNSALHDGVEWSVMRKQAWHPKKTDRGKCQP